MVEGGLVVGFLEGGHGGGWGRASGEGGEGFEGLHQGSTGGSWEVCGVGSLQQVATRGGGGGGAVSDTYL